jgi:microcystin-dependent protein
MKLKIKRMLILLILCLFSTGTFNLKPALAMNTAVDEHYIGQISLFAFDFAPPGWIECAGQIIPINQNQALFSLLGTTYGGSGITSFQLPDLQNASPIPNAKYYIAMTGTYPTSNSITNKIIGSISLFPYDCIPPGWVACEGQNLNLSSNFPLFALLVNIYGGDGNKNFGIPDLRSAAPIYYGIKYAICVTGVYPDLSDGDNWNDYMGSINLYAFKFRSGTSKSTECNGNNFAVGSNKSLFNLLGTKYGGDGNSDFGIPDLRGAVPSPYMGYYISTSGNIPARQ